MRLAAIDVGTNSVLLTIVDGELRPLLERATITRLGRGVDATRRLSPEAIERTLACLERYAAECAGVDELLAVGTSALRDAAGADQFLARAEQALGVPLRVISGGEEASLTYDGALSGVAAQGRVLVFDVGGGSTEVIVERSGTSLDIGSVRLFERHAPEDPPAPTDLEALRTEIRQALETLPPLGRIDTVVGVAGTVTTLKAIELRLDPYDVTRVHGSRLTRGVVRQLITQLAALPIAQRSELPGLEAGRADVILVGALIVDEMLDFTGKSELLVSDRGVRWGLLQRRARELQ